MLNLVGMPTQNDEVGMQILNVFFNYFVSSFKVIQYIYELLYVYIKDCFEGLTRYLIKIL